MHLIAAIFILSLTRLMSQMPPIIILSPLLTFKLFWINFEADDWCVTGYFHYLGTREITIGLVPVCCWQVHAIFSLKNVSKSIANNIEKLSVMEEWGGSSHL